MANKKFWLVVLAGTLVLGFSLTGCTTFQASGLQMGLVINGQKYQKVRDFSQKEWTNKFLGWGSSGGTLFNLSSDATDPQVREAVEKNIKKYDGDAAIDVKIKYGSNPIQWILSFITAGIWVPGTVTVTGTIVKAVN
ncbi:MAG: hypothetical protein LBG72_03615 [Spirochaetaceae bacterium]|jgi:hypothetical protein|nr:hypothetical protein [Spirochaetaceae bacterium]